MRKLIIAAAFAIVAFTFGPAGPSPSSATPGMVNAQGCHGHPRHCHSRGELRRNRSGRYYVAGHFHRGRHARRHRHR